MLSGETQSPIHTGLPVTPTFLAAVPGQRPALLQQWHLLDDLEAITIQTDHLPRAV